VLGQVVYMSVEDVKPGAQQCRVFAVFPTLTQLAGDWRSSRPSRFGVKGASSASSAGIAAALASELESPSKTAPRVKNDFIMI
jgi:hypothetical protein